MRTSLKSLVIIAVGALILTSCGSSHIQSTGKTTTTQTGLATSIHKIRHIVVIFQENRSFDSYFGTYPGADGIPMNNGIPSVCIPDPVRSACIRPYPDHANINVDGPHDAIASQMDTNNGKMNGFIFSDQKLSNIECNNNDPLAPGCGEAARADEIVGYHTQSDIPNYWAYAQHFVLQDHMFEPIHSWSFPSHLYLVSAWSASCAKKNSPSSCSSALDFPPLANRSDPTPYAWTDITWLLNRYHVSWSWYLDNGYQPLRGSGVAWPASQHSGSQHLGAVQTEGYPGVRATINKHGVPLIWNVIPGFTDVHQDHQLGNVSQLTNFFIAAKNGSLPSISWVLPNGYDSEHPPSPVSVGQSYVTNIVNAVMKSPDWNSTAIFITWDDWGGFYDNVVPPQVDTLGYGIRVPGLVISAYAKPGYIDHQTLSFDAYLKFIEDDFMGGARLNPKTDGRADPRPDVRENAPILGNLVNDFNFNQKPLPPLILPVNPTTTLSAQPTLPPPIDVVPLSKAQLATAQLPYKLSYIKP
ncbi:MAG: phospholipase [Actinobacteria bacterium]|nr:phospholipase [Actinomycetota bacterium]